MVITNFDSKTGTITINKQFYYSNFTQGKLDYLVCLLNSKQIKRAWNFLKKHEGKRITNV